MLAGWRSRRAKQMRQIRFDTRAVPAFFFCSSATSPTPPTYPPFTSSSPFFSSLSFSLIRIFLPDGLVSRLPRGSLRERSAAVASRTSYANADNNRTSIKEKVNFLGYGCCCCFFFFFFFGRRKRLEEDGVARISVPVYIN